MKPTIGRMVHYKDEQGDISPAIITFVGTDHLVLTLFKQTSTETGVITKDMAAGPRDAEARHWWWPERV